MGIVNNEEGPDFWDQVNSMADQLGLEGEGRANYVDDHMIQGGYTRVQTRESYAKVAEEGGTEESPGSRWGFGARKTAGGGGGKTGAGADVSDRF